MKVLFVVSSCCTPRISPKRIYTGYDYIVSDIAEKLGSICQVEIYSLNPCPENSYIDGVAVRSCVSYKRLLKKIRFGDFVRYVKIFFRSLPYIKDAIKSVLWYISVKDIDDLIKRNDYDIVHIHGVRFSCYISSLAAANNKKPFLFTMHGLISYGISGIPRIDSDSEQAAFSIIKQNDFIATAVSSGTKRVPCEHRRIDSNKIRVINNAIKNTVVTDTEYWYTKFPQTRGKRIVIGVGTIGSNKNQIQLLRAYLLLPKDLQKNTAVILAGKDNTNGAIEKFILENNLYNNVFICGFVDKFKLSNLYAIADYNVMLSITEGFGLSMIEAASYGIPTLTFSDLDAVKDIYSPTSMLLMDDRGDETVAEGIIKMFSNDWNRDGIVKESLKFNEDIYREYLDVYKFILERGSNIIPPKVITSTLKL